MEEIIDFLTVESFYTMARAILIYVGALILIRISNKRILGNMTPFDFVVSIILGSVLSRAVNGSAPLIPTLCAGVVIAFLHWLFAAFDYHFPSFRRVIRGESKNLVKDGNILWDQMRKTHLSENELLSQLRIKYGVDSIEKVKEARMETSGTISFIMKE
jgi:uncharacterized membrane protein YcaP (DUF421 family)